MRVEDGFQPVPYPELHPYSEDPVLPNLLRRILPDNCRAEIESDLVRFGKDIQGPIRALGALVHPPALIQYDNWGRRIDQLQTSEGWRRLKDIAIREGLAAIPHERRYGEHSRIYSFAKIMTFCGDSHVIMCPLSMTDGAARVLELNGTEDMKREIHSRFISRDPSRAFTSGQWMTEKRGGSDVSQTETTAVPLGDNADDSPTTLGAAYSLNGFKWFSSATDSDLSVVLARTGSEELGARSLSLFLVPLRLPLSSNLGLSSTSNGIRVHRLKNKFGTQALPTAELSLNDTRGYLIGQLNRGIQSIAPVLNITRIHAAVGVVGGLSRAFSIARAYASVRTIVVTGDDGARVERSLRDTPLHIATLARVSTTYHALVHLTFGAVALLGKSECGTATQEEELRLRLLTPAVKAFTAEKAISATQQCMESLGGQGYMEEVPIGRLIRDGTVDRIWEGTLNVLSLDLVRASRGNKGILPFVDWGNAIITSVPSALGQDMGLYGSVHSLRDCLTKLGKLLGESSIPSLAPVPILHLFAHVAAGLYLLEHVVWGYNSRDTYSNLETDVEVFNRWVGDVHGPLSDVERATGYGKVRETRNLQLVYRPGAGTQTKL